MIRLLLIPVIRFRWFLRCYAPSNIALDWLRTRGGLKWGVPAALILVPAYLFAASMTTAFIEQGAPGWLNVVVVVLIWDAMKFTVMAPVSLILLGRARLADRPARRGEQHAPMRYAPGCGVGGWTTNS